MDMPIRCDLFTKHLEKAVQVKIATVTANLNRRRTG